MRRIGHLIEDVADFGNLHAAYLLARRGKAYRAPVARFTFRLEPELLRLRRQILDGTYRPGAPATFEIRDPKPRTISAAPFRDRVLQHAVIRVLEPHLERWLDFDSYACRKGRGVDAALARAVVLSRRAGWVLRSDIAKCYASIDPRRVAALLARKVKDARLLRLFDAILGVEAHASEPRGLPIGSLTSQWLANLYLGELDRYVRERVRPLGYLRYMDDFALFFDDPRRARDARGDIALWLRAALGLEMNFRVTAVYPAARGWPFLGFRVGREGLRLRRETWRRSRRGLERALEAHAAGRLEARALVESASSRLAHLARASSRGLRRKELAMVEL